MRPIGSTGLKSESLLGRVDMTKALELAHIIVERSKDC